MALAHKVARDSMAMAKAMTNPKARDFFLFYTTLTLEPFFML